LEGNVITTRRRGVGKAKLGGDRKEKELVKGGKTKKRRLRCLAQKNRQREKRNQGDFPKGLRLHRGSRWEEVRWEKGECPCQKGRDINKEIKGQNYYLCSKS